MKPHGRPLPNAPSPNPPVRVWTFRGHSLGPSSDRGSTAAETVVIAPLLIVLVLFVVYLGRLGQTAARVHHAADQGARAASMAAAGGMGGAASSAALADLSRNGVACSAPSVSASIRGSRGGVRSVTVTVRCSVDRSSLALLAPGSQTVTASSTEVIDFHRAGEGRP